MTLSLFVRCHGAALHLHDYIQQPVRVESMCGAGSLGIADRLCYGSVYSVQTVRHRACAMTVLHNGMPCPC